VDAAGKGNPPRAPSGSEDLSGLWIKRGDVHNTEPGDVMRVESTEHALDALRALARRGVRLAVLQEHADGDLVKFYGVGRSSASAGPAGISWFEWFYHRDQILRGYAFDAARLAEAASRAAAALRLEVFGGDAIVGPDGSVVLIDLNAWPSFALYRDTAAVLIASHLASRFREHARTGVTE
jgi:predicted amidohydrolase